MEQVLDQLLPILSGYVPQILGAAALFVVGWLVAVILSAGTRRLLSRTGADAQLAKWMFPDEPSRTPEIRRWFGQTVFYTAMLFVLVAIFQTLQLTHIIVPLNRLLSEVFEFLPRVLSAGILLGIAWVLATILRTVIIRMLGALRIDERFGRPPEQTAQKGFSLVSPIADGVYWLVFVFFLPAILGVLALSGILDPVKGMFQIALGFLPNLVSAALILFIGWYLASVIRRIVTNLLAISGVDQLSERIGLSRILGGDPLSKVIGLIVYILVAIPIIIGALNAVELSEITAPASHMLEVILVAIPDIFGAALVLAVAYAVGSVVGHLAANVLTSIGFNAILVRMGISPELAAGRRTPSAIVGTLILVSVMLFASMEAAELMHFDLLAGLIGNFIVFGGHLILGLVVFGIGIYLANLAARTIEVSRLKEATLMAKGARVAILVLATAMAMRQMGLADDIVNLAFGLLLGAFAVAFALAIGLGGRDVAAEEMRSWIDSLKERGNGQRQRAEVNSGASHRS